MPGMTVNERPVDFEIDPQTPLLWALRDAANLTGTKYGCGTGDCGARDWSDLPQRMHYILHLFRAYANESSMLAPSPRSSPPPRQHRAPP